MPTFNIALLRETSILYVEEEQVLQENKHGNVFSKMFKNVYIAKDGENALELFKEHINQIDIIITDINLPQLDGIKFAQDVQKLSTTPIIIISQETNPSYTTKAVELGIKKYMLKPVSVNEIIQVIEKAVTRHKEEKKNNQITKTLLEQSGKNMKALEELISENKKLQVENKIQRTVIDNYVATFTTNKKGVILEASHYFCELMKTTEEDLIGTDVNTLRSANSQSNITKKMLEAVRTKTAIDYPCIFTNKSGLNLDFEVKMVLFFNNEELVDGYHFYLKYSYLV
jgi:YesN/AraC family two-component response regulator